jgi:hypothetical protein
MKRLQYTRYVAQGGDWGNAVTEQMALLTAPELLGIPTNCLPRYRTTWPRPLQLGEPAPSGLSADENHAYDQLACFYKHGLATPRRWRTARRRCTGLPIHFGIGHSGQTGPRLKRFSQKTHYCLQLGRRVT